MKRVLAVLLAVIALLPCGCDLPTDPSRGEKIEREPAREEYVPLASLPPEARVTLGLVRAGGPFPYEKDGAIFVNYERNLPDRPRGYWREYTVRTPGATDRGARRIVAGAHGEAYYSEDHYATFRRIAE